MSTGELHKSPLYKDIKEEIGNRDESCLCTRTLDIFNMAVEGTDSLLEPDSSGH